MTHAGSGPPQLGRMSPMTTAPEIPSAMLPGEVSMPLLGFGTWSGYAAPPGMRPSWPRCRWATGTSTRPPCTATRRNWATRCGTAAWTGARCSSPPSSRRAEAGYERKTLTASLRALGTSYVDLWLVHWPPPARALAPVWREFLSLRDQGLARAVGVSNYSIPQIDRLIQATGEAPAVNQIPWSPAQYDEAVLEESRERGVTLEGYSPLKGSDLGRHRADRDRGEAGGHPGPGRAALAPRARHRGDPEVERTRTGSWPTSTC